MIRGLADRVIVVGGGTGLVGRAVVRALLAAGARVIVPVRSEEDAERFYLEASAETVPRLRTATGVFDDPATPARIASVARREFGGIDHLVSVIGSAPGGALADLDAQAVQQTLEDNVSAPARFLLGMLRHLNGTAPVKRAVAVTPGPGPANAPPDAWSVSRTFLEGLIGLLRESRRPGLEFYALRSPRMSDPGSEAVALGRAVARLLAEGAAAHEPVIELATLESPE
ncbi:MAG TPA: SDR family NAD(P)-dependent oxidoreductase [Terriglobales bacterium]|nr:SDR family NAD(P)-dependent oxidoreductase [Terriglobales bacterium]